MRRDAIAHLLEIGSPFDKARYFDVVCNRNVRTFVAVNPGSTRCRFQSERSIKHRSDAQHDGERDLYRDERPQRATPSQGVSVERACLNRGG
jgi:hypothetical protein